MAGKHGLFADEVQPRRLSGAVAPIECVNYNSQMIEVRQTAVFMGWLAGLRDRGARTRIVTRMRRMEIGNPGDIKPVGEGISEMRVDYGPGYRLYFMQAGTTVIILLCGGDKSSQKRDIARAKEIAKEMKQ